MLGPHSHYEEVAKKREMYRMQLEAHGHTFEGREMPMTRFMAVADTEAEAEEIARRGAKWLVGAYVNSSKSSNAAVIASTRRDESGTVREIDPVEHYLNGVAVHGSPERVIDQIEKLRGVMFLDSLMLAPLSHSSFVTFTEKVLPHFI